MKILSIFGFCRGIFRLFLTFLHHDPPIVAEEKEVEVVEEDEHPLQNALIVPSNYWIDEGFIEIPKPEDLEPEILENERFIQLCYQSLEEDDWYSSSQ